MDKNEPNIREKNYDGTKCPYCEGRSLTPTNKIHYKGGKIYYQYVKCDKCDIIWKEVLEITRFKPCEISKSQFEWERKQ